MQPVTSSKLSYYRNEKPPIQLDDSVLSGKIVALMEKRRVSKQELKGFLTGNRKELAAFAIKTPINWIVFGKSMKEHVGTRSKLSKLLKKLDRFLSLDKGHFSEAYPRPVRENIARFYPADLNNNSESLIKMKQLLIGDYAYLNASPKIKGVPLSDLVKWIDHQRVPLLNLKLDLHELAWVLPALGYVDLSGYPKECIPFMVSSLNKVSHFASDWITDEGLESLARFSGLVSLDISECNFTDKGMEAVSRLTKLRSLNVSNCIQITDASIQLISSLSDLTCLNISGCMNVTYMGLRFLIDCDNLERLDVAFCEIKNGALVVIGQLISLKYLNLSCCKGINGSSLYYLSSLVHLEELNLSFLEIEDIGVMHLTDLEGLKILNLQGCRKITDKGVQSLCSQSLRSLGLRGCSSITDLAFRYSRNIYKTLKELDLTGCYEITDAGLLWMTKFTELVNLNIKGCNRVSDDGIYHLTELPNLTHLNLQLCTGTTDMGRCLLKTAIDFVKE